VITVLYEDNHLLVVNKPTGVATMGEEGDDREVSVHRWGCDYVRRKYGKPGRVYLGVVHRLDRVTSGVLVLARTSKAAARLSEQFRREGKARGGAESGERKGVAGRGDGEAGDGLGDGPEKVYLAVTRGGKGQSGAIVPSQGTMRDWVIKNERAQRMEVVRQVGLVPPAGAADAVLEYRSLRRGKDRHGRPIELVRVDLKTGRKHQIRLQFAHRGHPIDGDRKYGGDGSGGGERTSQGGVLGGGEREEIGLHAWRLSLWHPVAKKRMTWVAPVPESWGRRYAQLMPWPVE
jgi:23S rRNA pseudouridine1911/1915/1917 synthase